LARILTPAIPAEPEQRSRALQSREKRGDYVISAAIVGSLTLAAMWWSPALTHWFLVPLMACGLIAGVDAVRGLRGKLDLFDPRVVVACLAFYGFFATPILHVAWDRFGAGYDLVLSDDWRPWLGAMGALNAAGLTVYRLAQNWVYHKTQPSLKRCVLDHKRFYPVFAFAITISAIGASGYLWLMGGISGEVESFESNKTAYVGKGWLLTLAWPLAILSFIVLVFVLSDRQRKHTRWKMAVVLLSLAGASHFILVGLYGSRSATVWALFWMAGVVHYWFRRLSARIAVAGILLLIVFMYFYGFYKERGRAGLAVLRSPALWMDPKGYERDLKILLLDDFARADSNAFILHNLIRDPGDYTYRWGLTYAGALAILIPRNVWPDRPDVKLDAGTEAQYGKATFLTSYRVYGLGGEALLNFGPLGIVPIFALYGGVVGWYRRKLTSWDLRDARIVLAPLFTMWCASALVSDSDNLVFAAVTQGTLVIAAVIASSVRRPAASGETMHETSART
jgi:hypothetical protein